MTDADFSAFMSEFDRLHAALGGFRIKPDEARAKADAYWSALKHLPLPDVTAKADAWLRTETKMPKPVEWASVRIVRGVDLPTLTARDERDYLRAEALFDEDAPCSCPLCLQAGVSEKPLRFVPDVTRDGRDDRALQGNRVVTRGHWAHGSELAGYYRARGDFWNRYYEILGTKGRDRAVLPEGKPRHERGRSEMEKLSA